MKTSDLASLARLSPADLEAVLGAMTVDERAEFDQLLAEETPLWSPLPGPQTMALESLADITGYGGAAGGGKTDLSLGLALTRHRRVNFFRETGTELVAVFDRLAEILGNRDGYAARDGTWRFTRPDGAEGTFTFGSFPNPGDSEKYRGRACDLAVFDECQSMLAADVRFLLGWNRSTDSRQRVRALLCFNPPSTVEGRWLVAFFAPWLDKSHPNPAMPGELRWFATIDGKDIERPDGQPFVHNGETIRPTSRTFIPAKLADNRFLAAGGRYLAQLQSLPEPLRSQLLYGDFAAGCEDDAYQVIPTQWVEAAQARWTPRAPGPMDSLGVDVARGGRDSTILARRHGMWFDKPLAYPGTSTPNGAAVVERVLAVLADNAVVHIDVIGVGSSPYDILRGTDVDVVGVNVSLSPTGSDKSGRLLFANLRSQLWWRMREALDPANNTGIALPPDSQLLADLTAPKWKPRGKTIAVQSTDQIKAVLGRSPDFGSAYVLALIHASKRSDKWLRLREWDKLLDEAGIERRKNTYDPFDVRGVVREGGYDPFDIRGMAKGRR
jgi:hypothetical protein